MLVEERFAAFAADLANDRHVAQDLGLTSETRVGTHVKGLVHDVFLAIGQDKEVHILPGSASGLDASKRTVIPLDYHLHYETGLFVADFNGDGKPDIAALGYTETGVGTNGPLAVYVWCQL